MSLEAGREVSPDSDEAAIPLHGPNRWPPAELLPEYRAVVSAYIDSLTSLGFRCG